MRGSHAAPQRRQRIGVVGLLVLAAVSTVALVLAESTREQRSDAATNPASDSETGRSLAADRPPATEVPAEPARLAGSVYRPEPPNRIELPGAVVVPVDAVSTGRGDVLKVPVNVDRAGWWKGGSRLADPFGVTLIAGHVDSSTQGLGVFARLLDIRAGQDLTLRSRRLERTFAVRSLRLVPRTQVRAVEDLSTAHGGRRLVLVTCAPPYDKAHGGYQNLAVVTARPAGPLHRRTKTGGG